MLAVGLRIENPEAFSAPWRAIDDACQYYVAGVGAKLAVEMRKAAPRGEQHIHPLSRRPPRNRNLARAIQLIRGASRLRQGKLSYAIVGPTRTDYAVHVIEGTKPHAIERRRAKTLTVYAPGGLPLHDGTWIEPDEYGFAHVRRVRHPGSRPNDFRAVAIANLGKKDIPRQEWNRAFSKAWAKRGLGTSAIPLAPSVGTFRPGSPR